ncbi:MAG: SH3 domain-containing protein [Thermodesulfobacteriota bacterium]
MRLSAFSGGHGWLLAALGLAFLLGMPRSTHGQALRVSLDHQLLYSSPDFASPPVGRVPLGSLVNLVQQEGDWMQVEHQGTVGWIHRTSLSQPGTGGPRTPLIDVPSPVRTTTSSDEVALAGKGFTPEVEAGYRQRYPKMKYDLVDKVEAFQVDEGRLQSFIREGGLKP